MSHYCSSLCYMAQQDVIFINITFDLTEYQLLFGKGIIETCKVFFFFMFTNDSLCDNYVRFDAIIKMHLLGSLSLTADHIRIL